MSTSTYSFKKYTRKNLIRLERLPTYYIFIDRTKPNIRVQLVFMTTFKAKFN